MALKIRLRQQGCKNAQTYRVVLADARTRRDGKYVEKLGWYLPLLQENNCSINGDRVSHWLDLGAQMSDQVKSLVEKNAPEVMTKFLEKKRAIYMRKVEAKRAKKAKSA